MLEVGHAEFIKKASLVYCTGFPDTGCTPLLALSGSSAEESGGGGVGVADAPRPDDSLDEG